MENLNADQLAFARSFNFRRRAGRMAAAAAGLALAADYAAARFRGGSLPPPAYETPIWAAIGLLFLFSFCLNWVWAKCPGCGRCIGYSWWAARGLPQGLRCDKEIECGQALDS
ncbi:MAG TPA: hypothetical protein VN915_00120 [Elusimicrobiota bacterium]|nr:hypothetical protein [Elusimicrobiota bacterium]